MNTKLQTPCLAAIVMLAGLQFVMATGEAVSRPAAEASQIADRLADAPDSERFGIAYEALRGSIEDQARRSQLFAALILACAVVSFTDRILRRQAGTKENPSRGE